MPLTFAERRRYLRDRAVNAARMIRHGNFRLFRDSLVFEINHVRNLFKMWWHSKREVRESGVPDSAFLNRTRLSPASWRPTALKRAPTPTRPEGAAELAEELKKIRLRLQPRDDGERKSKWPRLRF